MHLTQQQHRGWTRWHAMAAMHDEQATQRAADASERGEGEDKKRSSTKAPVRRLCSCCFPRFAASLSRAPSRYLGVLVLQAIVICVTAPLLVHLLHFDFFGFGVFLWFGLGLPAPDDAHGATKAAQQARSEYANRQHEGSELLDIELEGCLLPWRFHRQYPLLAVCVTWFGWL